MKTTITTRSYVATSSGESRGIIDTDVEKDEWGIPFIPGRRMKGVIRESACEVCEMLNVDKDIVEEVFGRMGIQSGKLGIGNFRIEGYGDVTAFLHALEAPKPNMKRELLAPLSRVFSYDNVSEYYTETKAETAVGSDGTAQKHSLRTINRIRPDRSFVGEMDIKALSYRERALLFLAVKNLRRMGMKRHRGYGDIAVKTEETAWDFDRSTAIAALKSTRDQPLTQAEDMVFARVNRQVEGGTAFFKLPFSLTLQHPIVLSLQKGDQNTVNTERLIPHTTMRGVFAQRIIERLNLKSEAEKNEHFQQLFYRYASEELSWGAAYLVDAAFHKYYPAPRFLQMRKGEKNHVFNAIGEDAVRETNSSYKVLNRWIADNEGDGNPTVTYKVPRTTISFHSARDRQAGHSKTGSAEIFYYEALEKDQVFSGDIYGTRAALQCLKDIVGDTFTAFVGKSKNAQYGKVQVTVLELESWDHAYQSGNDLILTFITPAVFYNAWGFPDLSLRNILRYVQETLGIAQTISEDEVKVFARSRISDHYVATWRSKYPGEMMWDVGTALKIPYKEIKDGASRIGQMAAQGLGERRAEGFGRVKLFDISSGTLDLQESEEKFPDVASFIQSNNNAVYFLLQKLLPLYIKNQAVLAAYGDAESFAIRHQSDVTAHFIERVRALVMAASDVSQFNSTLHKLFPSKEKLADEKPVYKMLRVSGLKDKLSNFMEPATKQWTIWKDLLPSTDKYTALHNPDESANFVIAQQYWTVYLETVRKKLGR